MQRQESWHMLRAPRCLLCIWFFLCWLSKPEAFCVGYGNSQEIFQLRNPAVLRQQQNTGTDAVLKHTIFPPKLGKSSRWMQQAVPFEYVPLESNIQRTLITSKVLLEGHAAFTREDALRAERFPGSWSRMFIENIFLKYWWITFEDSRGVNLAIKNSVPVPVKTLEIRQSI